MNFAFNLILFIISILTLSICGGFATSSSIIIKDIDSYNNNDKLKNAHKKLVWASVITWFTVILVIVGGVIL